MDTINLILKYVGYACISLFLGWCSTKGESDFIQQIQGSILAILLTLTVLNTTLTNLLLNETLKFRKITNYIADISHVLDAMKRSSIVEIILIAVSLIFIIIGGCVFNMCPDTKILGTVLINGLLIFDIGYFMLVILDDVEGLYKLLKENNS